jgi:hypothetical protein
MVFGNRVKKEMIQPAGGSVFRLDMETFGRTNDEGRKRDSPAAQNETGIAIALPVDLSLD